MTEVPSRREQVQRAVARLLTSDEPGIRFRVRTELLGDDPQSPELARLSAGIEGGPKCSQLLEFEDVRAYTKWTGAHWRLVSLVELALPTGHTTAVARCDQLLDTWTAGPHLDNPQIINGLVREHAGTMGNPLAVASRLGMATDSRAVRFAEVLCDWQWPDGGWNCDIKASGRRSSFHETLPTMWGLVEYHRSTGEPRAMEAVARAAELLLSHRLFRAAGTGAPIDPSFVELHWPPFWRYDVLQALRVLALVPGALKDARADDAFELLSHKQLHDGMWTTDARWWDFPGVLPRVYAAGEPTSRDEGREAVDWSTTAHEMVTLNALLSLKAANRT